MSAGSEAKERRAKTGRGAEKARRHSQILEHLFGLHTRSRRVISEHRHRRNKLRDREVSDRSRRGLDWTNFFLADVQLSFGSFLAFYLADLGWSKQNVGLALTAGGLAAVAAQIPGDALADAVRWKRALAASGFVLIAAAALILALRPDFSLVYGPNHVFMTRLEQFVRVRPRPVPVWDPGSSRPGSLIVCGAATVATGNP
jgi:hypothetical protein